MANAKKCERCGKCFDPAEGSGPSIHIAELLMHTPEDFKNHKFTEHQMFLDFCPECTAQFKEFMNYGQHSMYIPNYIRDKMRAKDEMIKELTEEKRSLGEKVLELQNDLYWIRNNTEEDTEKKELKEERDHFLEKCKRLEVRVNELENRELEDWETDVAEAAKTEVKAIKERYMDAVAHVRQLENELKHQKEALDAVKSYDQCLEEANQKLTEYNQVLLKQSQELRNRNEELAENGIPALKKCMLEEIQEMNPNELKAGMIQFMKHLIGNETEEKTNDWTGSAAVRKSDWRESEA